VGTLTLDHVESEETSPARDINFDPLVLPAGLAPSDDPLLGALSAVYSHSFTGSKDEWFEKEAPCVVMLQNELAAKLTKSVGPSLPLQY
jgi:hypothetical protein